MPGPITITITAVDDPEQADHLIVDVDRRLVLLSFEDLDEVRWICNRGTARVDFAPANNPFDPTAATGGSYVVVTGGSVTSGPPVEIVLDPDAAVFRQFKYDITVVDGTRSGALDPHARVRRNAVYKKEL
jgi:hypothetical protein